MDKIIIEQLDLNCIVGTKEEERHTPQQVLIDITLFTDLSKAGETDNLFDTIDYETVRNNVADMVESSSFLLIEKLAAEIVNLCLQPDDICKARVRLSKPHALKNVKTVAVEIEREKA